MTGTSKTSALPRNRGSLPLSYTKCAKASGSKCETWFAARTTPPVCGIISAPRQSLFVSSRRGGRSSTATSRYQKPFLRRVTSRLLLSTESGRHSVADRRAGVEGNVEDSVQTRVSGRRALCPRVTIGRDVDTLPASRRGEEGHAVSHHGDAPAGLVDRGPGEAPIRREDSPISQ